MERIENWSDLLRDAGRTGFQPWAEIDKRYFILDPANGECDIAVLKRESFRRPPHIVLRGFTAARSEYLYWKYVQMKKGAI